MLESHDAVTEVASIDAVPSILKLLCEMTGMGFAAVARVTDGEWTACAVEDRISFGLEPGGQLDVQTTLCREVREAKVPLAINQASADPIYCEHQTPKTYGFESYVSVPIELPDGEYFGNLCAIDPRPADVANERVLTTFQSFARLIALELDSQRRLGSIRRELLDERAVATRRERLIAVLGHDLRNPLNSIFASTHLLEALPGDPERVKTMARRIRRNAGRMAGLVSDLLDFARAQQNGALPVKLERLESFQAAVEEVIDELRVAHPDRSLKVWFRIDRPVSGDLRRLQQLVSNLVANALTHGSTTEPVDVMIFCEGDELVIDVHNEGDVIPKDSIPGLFDAFKQLPSADHGNGLGLGLFICKQIVQGHGGTLQVSSTPELGTSFRAQLPMRDVDALPSA